MDAVGNQSHIVRVIDNVAEECQTKFLNFLRSFKDDEGEIKYKKLAERMQNLEKNSLPISFNDIMSYNELLSELVMIQFFKLFPYLCKATQSFINDCMEDTRGSGREYQCHFVDFPNLTSLRDLKTTYLGKLVKFRAQVIRSHPVHPELISGVFKCGDCGTVIKSIDQEFIYTQPSICANPKCTNRKTFELMIEESKFVDFQKVRVQETQGELPRGSVPRSMDIILRSHIVEMAQPGDHSEFIGTLIVIPDVSQMAVPGSKTVESKPVRQTEAFSSSGITGLKSLGLRELTYKLAFLATNVSTVNNKYMVVDDLKDGEELTYESLKQKMTNEEMEKIYAMSNDNALVANLSDSLFPTIYGCDEVKRGILLMLFGGVPKVTEEGTRLRGDTNICIVGDPSTAKSQFLKRIEQFAPRAVYTSGKASSAAGLTAAVVKDQESFEYVIEAGALMLANNGICCIDEFDKMDIRDQVAIHEAMEQQTISITKAGIKATLNAKTSILAAANPVGGRYDRSRSLRQNISLSGPIMSRFDLFFVLVDECSESVDYAIARKIVDLHVHSESKQLTKVYSDEDIRRYITFARCFEPRISFEAYEIMVSEYKKMRERDDSSGTQSAWRVTVRQLESLIRLSEAYAKMRLSDDVTAADVWEAVGLLNKSIIRVEQPDINLNTPTDVQDGVEHMEDDSAMLKISYEDYFKITGALINRLKYLQDEDENEITKKDLINWYLESVIDTIQDEQSLLQKNDEIEKIIQRLIEKDNVFMSATVGEGEEMRELLVLHPSVNL